MESELAVLRGPQVLTAIRPELESLKRDSWYVSREITVRKDEISAPSTSRRGCHGLLAIRTASCYVTFVAMGMVDAILGATLLHIRLMTNSSDLQMSRSFLYRPIGMIAGSTVVMILFDKVPKDVLLSVCCLLLGTATAVIPFCPTPQLLVLSLLLQGLFQGVIGSGCNVYIVHLWKKRSGPFTQGLHFVCSCGSFLAPFATGILVDDVPTTPGTISLTTHNESENTSQSSFENETLQEDQVSHELSREDIIGVKIVYAIVWFVLCLGCMLFALSAISGSCHSDESSSDRQRDVIEVETVVEGDEARYMSSTLYRPEDEKKQVKTLPKSQAMTSQAAWSVTGKRYAALLFTAACITHFGGSMEAGFGAWILSFIVKHIEEEFSTAIKVNTAYWATLAVGRFISIFTALLFRPKTILLCHALLILVSLVTYTFAYSLHIRISWISTCVVGVAVAPVFGQTLTVFREFGSGKSSHLSVIVIARYAGFMSLPSLIGVLFTQSSPMWFLYIMLLASGVIFVLVIILCILSKPPKRRSKSGL